MLGMSRRNMKLCYLLKTKYLVCIILLMTCAITYVATIDVYNMTDQQMYAAIYYYKDTAERATVVIAIPANDHRELPQPSFELSRNRELVFDQNQATLIQNLTWEQFNKQLAHKNVGIAGNYYIAIKNGRLKGYNATEWLLFKPIKKALHPLSIPQAIREQIKKDQPSIVNNPYKNTAASVRIGFNLSPEELSYKQKRRAKIKQALEKLLNRSLDGKYIPEIALIFSGGGYRAMLYSTGFLTAADELGLFDTIMYQVSLSGSTWAVGYLTQLYSQKNMPLKKAAAELPKKLSKGLGEMTPDEFGLLIDALLVKEAFEQLDITSTDIFGLLLGNRLFNDFGSLRHRVYLSDQRRVITSAEWPLPIYTAVGAESIEAESMTYEFSPFEVWAPWGMAIPSFTFGDSFSSGKRLKTEGLFAPEQPFDILMGTFGAAYAVSNQRIYEEIKEKAPDFLHPLFKPASTEIAQQRIAASSYYNFMAGIAQSPLRNQKTLKLSDAGLGPTGGLPYAPVSGEHNRRKPDVIIVIDVSENITDAKDLKKMEEFAKNKKLPFPPVSNYVGLDKKTMSVFRDTKNSQVPIIIYMPRVKDLETWKNYRDHPHFVQYKSYLEAFDMNKCIEDGCGTFDLMYKETTALQVQKLGEFNLRASIDKIKAIINDLIEKKSIKPS
jgi:cytosolic phospholipase A2